MSGGWMRANIQEFGSSSSTFLGTPSSKAIFFLLIHCLTELIKNYSNYLIYKGNSELDGWLKNEMEIPKTYKKFAIEFYSYLGTNYSFQFSKL
jgi:hypothetical protein